MTTDWYRTNGWNYYILIDDILIHKLYASFNVSGTCHFSCNNKFVKHALPCLECIGIYHLFWMPFTDILAKSLNDIFSIIV